jgi:uncharacterized protein
MKLQPTHTTGQHTFTAYGDGYVSVNTTRYSSNLIVLPNRLIPDWTQADFRTLSLADFELLAALDTEIILLGTGPQLCFPHPELMRPLIQAQKGLEAMDIHAACRTYNILLSEGRRVAAALIFS